MALPSKRLSKTRGRNRAAHFALKELTLSVCPRCKHAKLPHHVCLSCGYYNSRDVLHLGKKGKH